MATNFPTGLDNLSNPTDSDNLDSPNHATQHSDENDALEAIEAKLWIDGSTNTSTIDYRVDELENNNTGDQTDMSLITDTIANFNASCSDGTFAFDGDNISIFTNDAWYITDYTVTNSDLTGLNISELNNDSGYIASIVNEVLWDLSDVNTTSPTDWQVLTYNDTSGDWENQDPSWWWSWETPFETASATIDWSTSNNKEITITADTTLDNTNLPNGQTCYLKIIDGGNYTITWADTISWAEWTAPTLTGDWTDFVVFKYNGTTIYGDYGYNFS